ncbi:MAG TPA: ATP-binding cassette domain-containing protein, partial [Gammaproteobacteria bacterium]|nr:ATP-binding cassette domain-containing protein [Gammaproteobacteria bacterium]
MQDRPMTDGPPALLRLQGLVTHYGPIQALKEVSLEVSSGQIVALVGANGAGKTTLLRTVSGLQKPTAGRILYQGRDVTGLQPARRVAAGIVQVPEGRQVFAPMTVEDNLLLGAYSRPHGKAI